MGGTSAAASDVGGGCSTSPGLSISAQVCRSASERIMVFSADRNVNQCAAGTSPSFQIIAVKRVESWRDEVLPAWMS